jgi:hypothetical protein
VANVNSTTKNDVLCGKLTFRGTEGKMSMHSVTEEQKTITDFPGRIPSGHKPAECGKPLTMGLILRFGMDVGSSFVLYADEL